MNWLGSSVLLCFYIMVACILHPFHHSVSITAFIICGSLVLTGLIWSCFDSSTTKSKYIKAVNTLATENPDSFEYYAEGNAGKHWKKIHKLCKMCGVHVKQWKYYTAPHECMVNNCSELYDHTKYALPRIVAERKFLFIKFKDDIPNFVFSNDRVEHDEVTRARWDMYKKYIRKEKYEYLYNEITIMYNERFLNIIPPLPSSTPPHIPKRDHINFDLLD